MTVHNRREITLKGLQTLYNAIANTREDYNFDIFMTDDGCTDGTRDAVMHSYPSVHIVDGDGNLFWNQGMIKAWNAASSYDDYDYYLWFNDDVDLYVDSLRNLLITSKKHDDQSIIVGSMCDPNDKSLITYSGHDENLRRINDCAEEMECFATNGNLLLIPRIIYKKIGTNDVVFHHCEGDLDYGLRARKAGFVNYVAAGIFGECARHDNTPRWCNPQYGIYERLNSFYSPFSIIKRKDSFKFHRRHRGLLIAIKLKCKIYTKLLFPNLVNASKQYEV